MISCRLSLLFPFCFGWLNENIVGTASTVRILRSCKPNSSSFKPNSNYPVKFSMRYKLFPLTPVSSWHAKKDTIYA